MSGSGNRKAARASLAAHDRIARRRDTAAPDARPAPPHRPIVTSHRVPGFARRAGGGAVTARGSGASSNIMQQRGKR